MSKRGANPYVDVVLHGLEPLRRQIERVEHVDVEQLLTIIGIRLHRQTLRTFMMEKDPWGRPWKPLKPATIERKRSSKILRDTGRLWQSFTWRVEGDTLHFGTNVEYAPYHQFGTKHIPRRPFLPLDESGRLDLPQHYLRQIMNPVMLAWRFRK